MVGKDVSKNKTKQIWAQHNDRLQGKLEKIWRPDRDSQNEKETTLQHYTEKISLEIGYKTK